MIDQIHYSLDREIYTLTKLKEAYLYACKKDIELIKPGNVSINSPHSDANAQDYLDSSILSAKELFQDKYALGERILQSVKMTRSQLLRLI